MPKGSPLIVTGPNASGKSSLFRTLGGLWDIPVGAIERPCDASGKLTPAQVFLVPQRPYSVRGTLADQVTYPLKLSNRTPADEKKIMDLLALVEVAYLASRDYDGDSGLDAVQKWEDVLSLGEQQRIGCARLFYHDPAYAVLDECTSAVSIDVEKKLYESAHARGITSITISQRLALEEFHSQELRLGDANGDDGWALRDI